jgi:hypothetical protein
MRRWSTHGGIVGAAAAPEGEGEKVRRWSTHGGIVGAAAAPEGEGEKARRWSTHGVIVGAAAAPEGEGEKARRWSTRREVDGRAGARRADERDGVQDAKTAQSQNETSFRARTNACGHAPSRVRLRPREVRGGVQTGWSFNNSDAQATVSHGWVVPWCCSISGYNPEISARQEQS